MDVNLIFTLFISIWAFVAFGGFSLWLINKWLWESAKRDRYLNRYRFDDLGNPEFYFNPKTGVDYLPLPGNKAFPEQSYQVDVSQKRNIPRQPKIFVEGLPLNEDAALLDTSKALTSARSELSNQEVLALLQEGIEESLGKTQTLLQKFGVRGGPEFTRLGKIYDKLAGKEQ